jgi:hypothetical protein
MQWVVRFFIDDKCGELKQSPPTNASAHDLVGSQALQTEGHNNPSTVQIGSTTLYSRDNNTLERNIVAPETSRHTNTVTIGPWKRESSSH